MAATPVDEIPAIVASVRQAYINKVTRPLEWRRKQLQALRRLLEENEDYIVEALTKDLRRPKAETVLVETVDVAAHALYFEDNLDKLTAKESIYTPLNQKPLSFEEWKEPLGVVTVIAPWNYPVSLLLTPMAGAIAAGNACVLKPSELAPASAEAVANLVPKYMDTSAIRVVCGGVSETTKLLAQKVNHIMYTGGSAVGRIVMAAAAKNLTPITLELGGKCPVYVDKSANLATTARRIVWSKCLNAGQTCIAPDHVLVHEKVRDEFLKKLKEEHDRLYPGDPQKCPDLSRIINDRHYQRIVGLLENCGGEVFMGGQMAEAERFVSLTVVTDPSLDSNLMQEEIFGPILPVLGVKSMEEAIKIVSGRPTPLAAYVFERDSKVRSTWLTEVESGGACVNDCMVHICNMEMTGLSGKGESGMGRARGKSIFKAFSHSKVVAFQAPNFDPLVKYPPYKGSLDSIKFIIMGKIPVWVKLAFWGTTGAIGVALLSLINKHVDISITFK